jgi:hypothetical protein
MAYRCPVCDALQPDGEHLANHLAITAMLDREDHAAWLADYAPEYGDMGPGELAAAITPHVESVELEDDGAASGSTLQDATTPQDGTQPFEHAVGRQAGPGRTSSRQSGGELDPDTQAVLEEARELTAAMTESDSEGETGQESSAGDAPAADGDEADHGSTTDGDGTDDGATTDEDGSDEESTSDDDQAAGEPEGSS